MEEHTQRPRENPGGTAAPPAIPRRGLLMSLVALVGAPHLAPAGPADPPPEPDATPARPPSAIFNFGQHYRITHDGDAWSAEAVARWDVPGIGDREQPEPVHTERERSRVPGTGYTNILWRWWRPEDVARCSLCPACNAGRNVVHPELAMCMRFPREMPSEADAPLHRTGWGDVPFAR